MDPPTDPHLHFPPLKEGVFESAGEAWTAFGALFPRNHPHLFYLMLL